MSLKNAFNGLLRLHSRPMTIERLDENLGPYDIRVTPSNFSRNLSAPEEITIEGKEFIITKAELDRYMFGCPLKGDRLNDPDLGEIIISEVREMYDLGGAIMGFRCRTS